MLDDTAHTEGMLAWDVNVSHVVCQRKW